MKHFTASFIHLQVNNLPLFVSISWIYLHSHKVVYQKPCNLGTVYLYAWVKFYIGKCGCLGWENKAQISWAVLGRVGSEGACIASMDMGHAELGSLTHTLWIIISKLRSFLWNANHQCLNHLNTKPSRSEWV